jgi:CRP-like cAMP-binding protein
MKPIDTRLADLDDDDPSTFMPFKMGNGFYDPVIAKSFFKAFGKKEQIDAGTVLFVENEASKKQSLLEKPFTKALTTRLDADLFKERNIHRMYLLTDGQIGLTMAGKLVHTAWPGDVFGEMAVISEIPDIDLSAKRTATATATTKCAAYSLDGFETQAGLAQQPEFALMLMSVMFERLRFLAARLANRPNEEGHRSNRSEPVFDEATLRALEDKLERATVVRFNSDAKIMKEGAPGTSMYIVLEGKVAVAIGRKIVEKLGRGGMFGEMALVDQSPRTATAVAREDCALLSINRDSLVKLVKSDPAIGMAMMRAVAARMRYMNSLFQ